MENPGKFIYKNRRRYLPGKALSTAAVLCLIAALSVLTVLILRSAKEDAGQPGMTGKEAGEAAVYYNSRFKELYNSAVPVLTLEPELARELGNDLQKLDSILAEARNDLNDNAGNKEILEALVHNYRTRLLILEDMLEELKKKENEK